MPGVFERRWRARLAWRAWLLLVIVLAACTNVPNPEPPRVAMIPSSTPYTPMVPSVPPSDTPTLTHTPTATFTPTASWTPIVMIATYTPSVTFTPSLTYTPSDTPTPTDTFTPSPPPSYTPTEDQPAPVVMAVAPGAPNLVTPLDPNCAPLTTRITANIESAVGLHTIRLNYAVNGGPGDIIAMHNDGENLYSAQLGPFTVAGTVTYWLSMADNWGKWVVTDPQTLQVAACDVAAINATAAAASTAALTATYMAGFGGTNPLRFQASDFDLSTAYATPLEITLGAINGTPPYTFVLNTLAANGTVEVIDASRVRYTPKIGFIGDDTFTFLATDLNQFTDIGLVRVNVGTSNLNAQSQTVNVPFGATNFAITLVASGGLTPYGLVSIVSPPAEGTLTASGANSFVYNYTPPTDFLGTLTFTWSLTDSAPAYDEGVITINVVPGAAATSRIVFASDEGSPGNSDIYVINADGSNKVNLTNSPTVNDSDPAWSPDGTQIVFTTNRDGNDEIYVMNADGTGAANRSANAAADNQPVWAAAGGRIAFVSNRDGEAEIYTIPAGGGAVTKVTNNGIPDNSPTWSPDGTRIAYESESGGNSNIYLMNADGSGSPTQLTSGNADHQPAWSPNGRYVAFVRQEGSAELYMIGSDGLNLLQITSTAANERFPAWSPDSSQITYGEDTGGGPSLNVMWFNGQTITTLGTQGTQPSWKP